MSYSTEYLDPDGRYFGTKEDFNQKGVSVKIDNTAPIETANQVTTSPQLTAILKGEFCLLTNYV